MLEHYERVFGPLPMLNPEDMDVISRPIDFLGVNYYNPTWVRASSELPLLAETVPARGRARRRWAGRSTPRGLYDLLLRLRADYGDLEIWITENGAAFDDERLVDGVVEDPSRVAFLRDHLDALRRAALEGVRRAALPRVVAAGQLRVGARLRQALRHRARGLRDAGADSEAVSALWYRDHIREVRSGVDRV